MSRTKCQELCPIIQEPLCCALCGERSDCVSVCIAAQIAVDQQGTVTVCGCDTLEMPEGGTP